MLPGLQELLEETPEKDRRGWVVNPLPMDYRIRAKAEWFKPTTEDLRGLANDYNNCAIALACGLTETTVRKWLRSVEIERDAEFNRHNGASKVIVQIRKRAERLLSHSAQRSERRLTKESPSV